MSEIGHAHKRAEEGKDLIVFESLEMKCCCKFNRKYQLPCKHLFQLDIYGKEKVLTDTIWEKYLIQFEDCGFEVYYSLEKVDVFFEEQSTVLADKQLEIYGSFEEIKDMFWSYTDKQRTDMEVIMKDAVKKLRCLAIKK